ncbi:winged helix-turn-helix transcriptional regulator [Albibacillus kandeliae]|uniref:winged helix-turn-helix transcriptional regulator n=1 Tax=Albibacillus kandeliae TaxID=2174228 RepID=UPI000D692E85|nr:helix-turn-helix domain-containing protein [Albibacillus kandeliae]
MRWNDLKEESCPVARGLSVIGDRWTMMVLRDCFQGIRRFDDFQKRLGITRHVLADRLRKLEEDGVLERRLYQDRPPRHEYRLTEKGLALLPILVTLIQWANTWEPHPEQDDKILRDRETGAHVEPLVVDSETRQPLTHRTLRRIESSAAPKA